MSLNDILCCIILWRAEMSITEDRIDEILRTSMFSNKSHQEQLKQILRSSPGELTEEELENVAGGVYTGDFSLLDDELIMKTLG